jgi:hypothetical protein
MIISSESLGHVIGDYRDFGGALRINRQISQAFYTFAALSARRYSSASFAGYNCLVYDARIGLGVFAWRRAPAGLVGAATGWRTNPRQHPSEESQAAGGHEFCRGDGGRPHLAHDDATGAIGEFGGLRRRRSRHQSEREDGDSRIAGARNVEHFLCPSRQV